MPDDRSAGIDAFERERRAGILRDIAERVREDGPHVARPHDDRARQFMPFAALKGYRDLIRERERMHESRYDPPERRTQTFSNPSFDDVAAIDCPTGTEPLTCDDDD